MSVHDFEMAASSGGFANGHCDGYNWMGVVVDFLFVFFFFCDIRSFKGLPFILFW